MPIRNRINTALSRMPIGRHKIKIGGTSSSSTFTIALSKLKKIAIVAMFMIDENIPHSPKFAGVYSCDKIGVTMIGNTYIIILLDESLAVFINNE